MDKAALYFALLALTVTVQDKSTTPVSDIIECVQKKTCKNATTSTISWADFGVLVQTFTDGKSSYALAVAGDGSLSIWVTLPGERSAGRLVTLGAHGRVLSAELGRQPGENFPMRMTPEQTAQKRELRKAYRSSEKEPQLGTWGEQHKSFWQEQANAAVATIRRQMELTAGSPSIPAPSPYSRVAAARFAIQNGWAFPKTNLVVAIDAFFGAVDGTPVRQSIVDQEKEALEIAELLGPDVKTAFAASRLDCPNGRTPCYARDVAVFVVGGLWEGNSPGAGVQLYSPGSKPGDPSTLTHAVIDLERRDGGWVGTRYRLGPSTLTRR